MLNFNFSMLNSETVDNLRDSKTSKRKMVGTPWYYILLNQVYREMFAFISPKVHQRWILIDTGLDDEYVPNQEAESPSKLKTRK